jgi:hypothetical protein
MTETLPANDSDSSPGHSEERLGAAGEKERRMTALFRRWPALSNREGRELRRLWDERIRRAKQHAA